MTGRMRWQEGSLEKRRGKWYGFWREDTLDAEGRLKRVRRHRLLGTVEELPTTAEARLRLLSFISGRGARDASSSMTVAELAARWQSAELPQLKPSTARYYQTVLKAHVLPACRNSPLGKFGRHEAKLLLAEKAAGLRRNSLRGIRVALQRLYGYAVESGWLPTNPMRSLALPRSPLAARARRALAPADVIRLVNALPEPAATLVFLLAATGLRVGEALALRWSDLLGTPLGVKTANATPVFLSVTRRIYDGREDSTKTEASRRLICLPDLIFSRLEKLPRRSEWIFAGRTGRPLVPGNLRRRVLKPTAKKLGIDLLGFHDLRHSMASWMHASGVPLRVAGAVLGQADEKTTLRVYTHSSREQEREAVDAVANLLKLAQDGTRENQPQRESSLVQ